MPGVSEPLTNAKAPGVAGGFEGGVENSGQ